MKPRGLSLIEMLIAAAITGVLLIVVTNGIQSASSSTRMIQTQQLLTEDLRTSGNLISDELSQAYHIYPPGAEITLNSTSTYTVTNFDGSNVWTVGTDPIIAAILPPEDLTRADLCATDNSGCLRLVAYYPLLRSTVTASTSGTPEFIGNDPQNTNVWTVFRYMTYLSSGKFSDASSSLKVAAPSFSGSRGELLADYIQPTSGFTVDWSGAGGSKCLVVTTDANGVKSTNPRATCPTTGNLESVTEMVFQLRGQMTRGTAVLVPGAGPLVFRGTPRNLGSASD
ncbi:MAG: type II secretion system protein [Meiothermus sp.]|nr:type II secretion system protein [Meiothermus sp.]